MSGRYSAVDDGLLQRARSEFLEMPGLRLTCRQAQRLWGLDEWICNRLLESLVEAKFLCRSAHGMYTRLSDGHAAGTPFRTVNARVEDDASQGKEAV